jgi:hypothetical protein
VEDTGAAPGLVDQKHLLLQGPGDDGSDASPVSHGTFVYSEIAAPKEGDQNRLFGLIPKSQVYVTKAVLGDGTQHFMMDHLVNGWVAFSALMDRDPSAPATSVVNISAFGEPTADLTHIPSVPANDSKLLLVAAAGNNPNGGTEDAPRLNVFPRLSSGSQNPLLIVGALGTDNKRASYSNWNNLYVQLFAPGDCVCGAPGHISGTSQAVPFVTTAAAILASARPDWKPLRVMWRLISTADHPDVLNGKAFAGTVNLARALDNSIIAEEIVPGGVPKIHRAKSIVYDADWKSAFSQSNINVPDKEVLRLYAPRSSPGAAGNLTCFAVLQNLLVGTPPPICVNSKSKVTLGEDGGFSELTADLISDIILPLRSPGGGTSNLPDITLGP